MNNAITRRNVLKAAGSVPLATIAGAVLGSENAQAVAPPWLQTGSIGPAVIEVQQRLAQLRLMPGKADGKFGAMTHQAMVTLQKLYGVRRDGIVDAVSQHILLGARPASMPAWARGFRAGIDIDRQVMFFYRGREFQVIGISSGSGKTYQSPESTVLHVAITPRGRFRIQRRVSGPDVSPLGILYDPGYFIGDYAIHGSAFVPPWPASHGCIRVDMLLRRYVAAALPVGAPIKIR